MSYMNTSNWGYSSQQATANHVDYIADKMNFGIDMINNTLMGVDTISKELIALAGGQTPPKPEQLKAMAARLDTYQNQVKDGLNKIKEMTKEIDKATDAIQQSPSW